MRNTPAIVDALRRLGLPIDEDIKSSDFQLARKKAYHLKSLENHPDRNQDNPNAKKNFQEINDANTLLSDPESALRCDDFITTPIVKWGSVPQDTISFLAKAYGQLGFFDEHIAGELRKRVSKEQAEEYQQACSPESK